MLESKAAHLDALFALLELRQGLDEEAPLGGCTDNLHVRVLKMKCTSGPTYVRR